MKAIFSRKSRFAILILLALISIGLAWASRPRQFPLEMTLKNGAKIRILELAYGKTIYPVKVGWWKKFVTMLPSRLQPAGFTPPKNLTINDPSLVLTFDQILPRFEDVEVYDFGLVDDNGYETRFEYSFHWNERLGRNERMAQVFSAFPQRSRKIKLRIYPFGDDDTPIGETTLNNPYKSASLPFPDTKLPKTEQVADLSVVLVNVTAGLEMDNDSIATSKFLPGSYNLLQLAVLTKGVVDTNWGTMSVTCKDATGNTKRTDVWKNESYSFNGYNYVWVRNALWPVEPIHFKIEIARQHNFSSNETWSISNISVPQEGAFKNILQTNRIIGQTVIIQGVGAPGVLPPLLHSYAAPSISREFRNLFVDFPGHTNGFHMKLVSVTDDSTGLPVETGRFFLPVDGHHTFEVKVPDHVKAATVELAVQKSLWVDFTVQPQIFSKGGMPQMRAVEK